MKNKFLIVLVFCLLLCGCGNYRELNELAIITGVAIDKQDDEYQLSFLIANSQKAQTSSKEGEAQTTVYSGTGKNLTEAVRNINSKSSKQLYYGHINVVIISEEIGKEGFLEIADRLLRNPETRKQFHILQAKDTKAKNILKIISPLESFPSQNISDLIQSNQMTQSISSEINYSLFIGQILDEGRDPVLPTIKISGDVDKGSKEKNVQTTEPETYLKLDTLAVYRGDKFVDYTTKEESQDINILNNSSNENMYNFKYNDSTIAYTSDNIKTKINIKSPSQIEINVKAKGFISEINENLDLEKESVIKELQNTINSAVKKRLEKTLNSIQDDYHADVVGFGNKIYKKYPDEWKKLEKKWNDKYLSDLDIKINTDFVIESTGALDQTIKEVLK